MMTLLMLQAFFLSYFWPGRMTWENKKLNCAFYSIPLLSTGNQYKINIMFTSTRAQIHTYGRLQLLLVDKDGLNETHPITK